MRLGHAWRTTGGRIPRRRADQQIALSQPFAGLCGGLVRGQNEHDNVVNDGVVAWSSLGLAHPDVFCELRIDYKVLILDLAR